MIKNKKDYKRINKAGIISEYLSSENTYKSLGAKYDIVPQTIQGWVRSHRKNLLPEKITYEQQSPKEQELQTEVLRLHLKNQLLEEIIKISEEQMGIKLLKKVGTKRS